MVTILSVRPESDLEGDDDNVPFYDNHADIYGTVVIDGQAFDLPTIGDNDHPHWEGRSGRFEKVVASSPVQISLRIRESDDGVTGDDDVVDVNPGPGKADLDFSFDLCALRVAGDVNGGIQQVFESDGGSDGEDATIRFRVELADGRPVTSQDLALMEVDLVQVISHADRLVSGKPTIVMVRVANNFSQPIAPALSLNITGNGFGRNDTFTITPALGVGEVRKIYFYSEAPLILPQSSAPYQLVVHAILDPAGIHSGNLPPGDCRVQNNASPRIHLKVVDTGRRSLAWAKVGTLLDIPEMASDAERNEIRDLGMAYINAIYPATRSGHDWPVPVVPPVSASLDWLVTVLAAFGVPADSVLPFWLVFELNHIAAMSLTDRLMGVLPAHWFERFNIDLLTRVAGVSLGEFAPHAVIFTARTRIDGSPSGPDMVTPAHELGHTYGLSVDSRLRTNWACAVDWPGVGDLPCGVFGGWDEGSYAAPVLGVGNPASGYWVRRGGEPAAVAPLVDQEQCNSRCFMETTHTSNRHTSWGADGRWIDPADYSHLLDKLAPYPDPAVVYVSGMITSDDQIYLGPVYQFAEGIPDKNETSKEGLYALRLVGSQGTLLEIGIPVNYNSPDLARPLPITFFGFFAPFPDGTRRIQIWNRRSDRLLAETVVSPTAPAVQLVSPTNERTFRSSDPWDIHWTTLDADGGTLTTSVLMSANGEDWWPLAYRLAGNAYRVEPGTVPAGGYYLKLAVNDEAHVQQTAPVRITIVP